MLKEGYKKILFLTNYASPYRVDFFNELGKYCKLTVLFAEKIEDQTHRSAQWFNSQNYRNFEYVQLKKCLGFKKYFVYLDVIRYLNNTYDAIVICGYGVPLTLPFAVEILKLKQIPFYLEVDGGFIRPDTKLKHWLKKHLVSAANGWFSSGKETMKYLTHYGANPAKIYEYPFSSLQKKDILPQVLSIKQKQALRQQLGITEEKVLISVGQFIYRKGYDLLLKAAQNLPTDIGIYIIGDEPTQELMSWKRDKNLTHIHFVGFQPKETLKKWYQAADVFVLPTREDIWGLVINEAMAQGLPVITTDKCVAGLELIRGGENGYIVPVADVSSLARAIIKIFAQDYRAMGQKSLEIINPYTIENMVKKHMKSFIDVKDL